MITATLTPAVSGENTELETWFQTEWAAMTFERGLFILVLILGSLAAIRIVMRLLKRVIARSPLEKRIQNTVIRAVHTALYIILTFVLLDYIGFPITSLLALVGVLGLALSLAVQDVLANVAGGMVLLFSKPFALGDYISTGDGEGTVEEIGLTHTKLDTAGGQRVMLPNSKLVDGKIVNFSTRGVRRVDHAVTASYDDATETVRTACLEAVRETPGVLDDPAPVVIITNYGESAIEYHVRFWTNVDSYWDAHAASLEAIRRAFDRHGVTMTYNHLNVHILDRVSDNAKE